MVLDTVLHKNCDSLEASSLGEWGFIEWLLD